MDCIGFPVLHHLLELAQTPVLWVDDAIQPSHPLLCPSPALSLYQHQGPFWVGSSQQVYLTLMAPYHLPETSHSPGHPHRPAAFTHGMPAEIVKSLQSYTIELKCYYQSLNENPVINGGRAEQNYWLKGAIRASQLPSWVETLKHLEEAVSHETGWSAG